MRSGKKSVWRKKVNYFKLALVVGIVLGGGLIGLGTQTSTAAYVAPTATPTQAPQPTPQPTPTEVLIDGAGQQVELWQGCNPEAWTGRDGTPIAIVVGAVSPVESLMALWAFKAGVWVGYSPQSPDVSDLRALDRLDVVFICVDAVAMFDRPEI